MQPAQLEENATFARRVIEVDQLPSPATLVESKVCLEGGALVVDADGTLLAIESSILNENRHPGLSRSEIEEELCVLLGLEKIIWFPGRKGLDVTDVHADAEVTFVRTASWCFPARTIVYQEHGKNFVEKSGIYYGMRRMQMVAPSRSMLSMNPIPGYSAT